MLTALFKRYLETGGFPRSVIVLSDENILAFLIELWSGQRYSYGIPAAQSVS